MQEKSVIARMVEAAGGVYAPGHLGELTQIVDLALVDAVIEEPGHAKRFRLLPSRVVVYCVLAPALFENCSHVGAFEVQHLHRGSGQNQQQRQPRQQPGGQGEGGGWLRQRHRSLPHGLDA